MQIYEFSNLIGYQLRLGQLKMDLSYTQIFLFSALQMDH